MARLPLVFTNKRRFRTADPKLLAQDLERFVDDIKRAGVEATETGAQMLHCWCADNLGGITAVRYLHTGANNAAVTINEKTGIVLVPTPGTLTRLEVWLSLALATADVVFTVRINGADTGLTVTIAAGAQSGSVELEAEVEAGDRVAISTLTSAADSTVSAPRASLAWMPEAA